jgi:serine/threonine protein kinase
MDKSIGDDPTMKPKDGRNRRGAFAPGDVIAGRYVVESIIGEGGMGIVYQCLDRVGGVKVAVKCLPPEVSRNADEMEDIRDNYRLVADLHHPNIAGARTLEVDGATGDYYLVMDLARGMSLKRWMKRNPRSATEGKLAVLRQVAAALDYAHAQKVIHRDVKPENVMVDDEGGVKVLDFGLAAQIRSSQSRTSNTVTSKGGTPGYKSPEQWLGRPQRAAADVYSFGVLAYWMLSGHLPFDGDDLAVLGHAVLTAPVEPIPDLPAHVNAALAKALAKEPNERFASCGAVVDALEGRKVEGGKVEGWKVEGGKVGRLKV